MNIFVGSTKKYRHDAEHVAKLLKSGNLNPIVWWDAFEAGHATLSRLIDVSEKCDGAVFVFGDDDEVFERARPPWKRLLRLGGTSWVAGDNILVEYGIFVARHGSRRTIVYKPGRARNPTDLAGITYLTAATVDANLVTNLKQAQFFAADLGVKTCHVLHVSSDLERSTFRDEIPPLWHSRAMYIGSRGALRWAAVETSAYAEDVKVAEVSQALRTMAKNAAITQSSCIISFGPGLGLLDKAILPAFVGTIPAKYVPIDINDHLAMQAAHNVASHPNVYSPFCIVADFETDMTVIGNVIKQETEPRRVWMVLGGTFGNIETGEDVFLHSLKNYMDDADSAILDVSVKTPTYSPVLDPWMNVAAWSKQRRAFIASGVARRRPEPERELEAKLEQFITVRTVSHPAQVPESTTFEIACQVGSDRTAILYARRYDYDALSRHLVSVGFAVVDAKRVQVSDIWDRALFLIKKA